MSASDNAAELGSLPQWDLSDLYPGRDSAELKAALADSESGAKQFRIRYEGKLAALSGADLAGAIRSYEQLQETTQAIRAQRCCSPLRQYAHRPQYASGMIATRSPA